MVNYEPIVSVLMTAYNREMYIAEAIESVLASTFKDFELIIVDDCSSDKTVEIAKKYEILDSRVKVYINEKNLGDYPNRNKAAQYACGKYIKYLDSDDTLYTNSLSIMVKSMEKYQGKVGLCCGIYAPFPLPVYLNPRESFLQHFFNGGLFGRSPLSAIINRDYFISVGCFNEERMVSDFEFFFRVGLIDGIVCMQDGLGWNRIHEGQEVTESFKFKKRYEEIEMFYLLHNSCPLNKSEKELVQRKKQRLYFINKIKKLLSKVLILVIVILNINYFEVTFTKFS